MEGNKIKEEERKSKWREKKNIYFSDIMKKH